MRPQLHELQPMNFVLTKSWRELRFGFIGLSDFSDSSVKILAFGAQNITKDHTDTAQPNFLPRHSETEYIECQMLLHTAWHLYCPWISATITHLTCAVSDLLQIREPSLAAAGEKRRSNRSSSSGT